MRLLDNCGQYEVVINGAMDNCGQYGAVINETVDNHGQYWGVINGTMDNIEQSLRGPWTTMDNIRGVTGGYILDIWITSCHLVSLYFFFFGLAPQCELMLFPPGFWCGVTFVASSPFSSYTCLLYVCLLLLCCCWMFSPFTSILNCLKLASNVTHKTLINPKVLSAAIAHWELMKQLDPVSHLDDFRKVKPLVCQVVRSSLVSQPVSLPRSHYLLYKRPHLTTRDTHDYCFWWRLAFQ